MPPKEVPKPGAGNRLSNNVEAVEDDEVVDPPPPPAKSQRRKPRRVKADGDGPGTTTVYVSEALFARAESYRRKKSGRRNVDILNEALDKHLAELPSIIERSRVSTGQVSALFGVDPRTVKYLGGGGTQWQFKPTEDLDRFLDQIAEKLGFTSRSTWIPPLLNAFLPGKKETAPATAAATPVDLDALWAAEAK